MMRWALASLLCGALAISSCASTPQAGRQRIIYPASRTVDQVDTHFGVAVADPYRWLEQDVRTAPEVAQWVEAQNNVTRAYLDALPERAPIEARLRELWSYDQYSVPVQRGERLFFTHQRAGQNQAALYVQDGVNGEPRLLLDPNTWSQDGATNIADFEPSPDGARVAYSVQDSGSDWRIIRVLDVATAQTLPDEVRWAKFTGIEWHPDGQSFFYSRYPEPPEGQMFTALNYNHAVYAHRIGSPQSQDPLIYTRPEYPRDSVYADVSGDDRWLTITVSRGTGERYEIVLIDLRAHNRQPRVLIPGFENNYELVGTQADGRLLFLTDRNAPRGRIVSIDPARPEERNWREVVAQRSDVLSGADQVGNQIVARYLVDARSSVQRFSLSGELVGSAVELPGLGSVQGFGGSDASPISYYGFSSFNRPPTIYRYDTRSGESGVFRAPQVDFNPDDYVVEQVFYASKDGTRVPMFIVHRRDVTPNGARPTLLYAYGGFNAAQLPAFQPQRLQWMEMGGVFVLANIRGGSEYGAEWHDGGRLLNKQNVFDDFIAAGEHLVEMGWTSPEHLAVQGRSNGGLLIGAVVNQRPDLFAAALPQVGVMDMLRFNQFSAGRFWTDDYGDLAEETHFRNLYAYSPYHNVRDGVAYPATLITTADTDDRVVPGHSFKYAARMQAAQGGSAEGDEEPLLIRVQTRGGHGTGRSTDQLVGEFADMWAFIAHHTGLEPSE
ncbi:MAG TPA: prolyl oligopeptidase family serine peptidase [Verrucomicrobiae bacterium]|nr:prolyl oligopeptidase family serine peptidase [Verrucomicrobiae bacterium]